VVRHKGREFVLADIPGLIEGAADGAGIGDRFLGHVERCRLLLHLVDAAGDDPLDAYRVVRGELDAYGAGLEGKPEIVALSRTDLLEPDQLDELRDALADELGAAPAVISAATGAGIDALLDTIVERLGERAQEQVADPEKAWSPL
jgi:GTP-binding protein